MSKRHDSYELSLEGNEIELPPSEEGKPSEQRVEELRLKLDILSSKLTEVQKELANAATVKAGGKVMAPFEVVDDAGRMIFRVRQDPRGFEMATSSGPSVAWGSALEAGGVFKTRSSATFPEVVMGSAGNFGGFAIRDAEQRGRASVTLSNGKPSLELSNENHVGIVSITQGSSGGGHIQLGNAAGNAMVQAGITAGNCGKVETYPLRPPGGGGRCTRVLDPGEGMLGGAAAPRHQHRGHQCEDDLAALIVRGDPEPRDPAVGLG